MPNLQSKNAHPPSARRTAGGACLLLALLCAPRAAAAGLTPEDVVRLRSVESAVISPDGSTIAYTVSRPRALFEEDDGTAWRELHVARGDGELRPFVTGEVVVAQVSFTPDGTGIAFVTKRGGDQHRALYSIPVDGGEARRLLAHEGADVEAYSFSPDGERVALLAAESEPKAKEKLEKKGFKAEVYEEDRATTRVWVASLGEGAGEPEALKLPSGAPGYEWATASAVRWSPAGDRLAVVLQPTPMVDDEYMKSRVHVVDSGSGEILADLANPGKLGDVRWSPDGEWIAVVSGEDSNDPREGRLMVAPAAGGALVDLRPGYLGHVIRVEWLDEETLAYIGHEGTEARVYTQKVEGPSEPHEAAAFDACWRDLSVSADGRSLALVGDAATHPEELFRLRLGSSPERLTETNPWLVDVELAPQEVVTYEARDGEMIEAVLNRPLGEKPGQRYPLIMHVHGGPEAHWCNGWVTGYSRPGHMASARGFAVLAPNYRGSTGRGVQFSKDHQKDFAGKEFDDLVDGIDHLVEAGLVDGGRVGITGGSYGGFASAWGATYYTERYAAAVMFVGISDQISKFGTSDIPNEMYLVHQRMYWWEDPEFMLSRSPISYVEQAKTPILILHGKEDPRVNPGQSMELYRSLKTLGKVPVRLVLYPGEGHGNRKAAARYDYSLRMLRWFEHYLQGEGGAPPEHALDYEKELGREKEESAPAE